MSAVNWLSFAARDSILLDAGYICFYRDCLNRSCFAEKHAAPSERFDMPPNFFDNDIGCRRSFAETRLRAIRGSPLWFCFGRMWGVSRWLTRRAST